MTDRIQYGLISRRTAFSFLAAALGAVAVSRAEAQTPGMERREERRENREERREDRRENREDRREDRQDRREDRRDAVTGVGQPTTTGSTTTTPK